MNTKLFELVGQIKEFEKIADSEDLEPELIRDTLESLEWDFETKAVNVAKFVLDLESRAEAIGEAAKLQKARADRIQRRADSIRAYLLWSLQCVDRKRIETADLVIARRNNPVAVQITDEKSVPDSYWVQPEPPPKKIDKRLVKDALQSGVHIEGAYLESGERVVISL
jgi:hypothetical protein